MQEGSSSLAQSSDTTSRHLSAFSRSIKFLQDTFWPKRERERERRNIFLRSLLEGHHLGPLLALKSSIEIFQHTVSGSHFVSPSSSSVVALHFLH